MKSSFLMSRRELLAAAVAASTMPAWAQDPKPARIPAEDFARRPKLTGMQFSPDGKRFAALEQYKGRQNITVAEIDSGKLYHVTEFERFDVDAFRWLGNTRLFLQTTDYRKGRGEEIRGAATYAVNVDGSDGRMTLFDREENPRYQFRFEGVVPGSDTDILASSNQRGQDSLDLVRLNTVTMKWTVLSKDNPGYVTDWVVDKDLVPRAVMTRSADWKEQIFKYRDSASSSWREIGRYPLIGRAMTPLQFLDDGTLLVMSNLNDDRRTIYYFDTAKGQVSDKFYQHPVVDADEVATSGANFGPAPTALVIDPKSREVIGVTIEAEKPETMWFDGARGSLQRTMDISLPAGNVNTIRPLGEKSAVVSSRSSRDPGTVYLFDGEKRQLREIYRPRAWIKPAQMSETKPWRFAARDGLSIPGYLTLPTGRDPKNLPLIAWIHGGPQARDDWGWHPEVQFFANRGYAVFQPNYRGSTGFGYKHVTSGFKQWGGTMQDDITDGIRRLIADGVVDAKRVCIGGGSYGGYATMAGLVKEPEMFRCGINVVGVTDLIWDYELGYSDFNKRDDIRPTEMFLDAAMGNPKKDRELLERGSPRLHADRIKAPVLFVHGGGDQRVPIKHAEGMRDAMEKHGKPYEWLVFPEEGHGWRKEENFVSYYNKMEEFLGRHMPA